MNILNSIYEILKATFYLFIEMAPYIMLGLIFVAILNYFFTKDLIVKHVGKNNFWSVLKAALFGVPLPLCSCGVVPSAVYMAKNGASRGAVVSFLISTPQTGIDSIIATWGMLGPVFGIYRPFAAFVMGIFGGTAAKYFDKSKAEPKKIEIPMYKPQTTVSEKSGKKKLTETLRYAFVEFIDDISSQFLVGLLIAGLIAYFVPNDFFSDSGFNSGIPAMLLMVAIGIPMYVCATASIPIAITLMMKGFTPGVAFVFLASGPATNAASLAILFKVLGKKTTSIFVASIVVSSMAFGLLLDEIYKLTGIDPHSTMLHAHHHGEGDLNWFQIIVVVIFSVLILLSFYRKFLSKFFKSKEEEMQSNDSNKILIEGMTCNHCVMNVKKAISATVGVTEVEVNLNEKSAYVSGNYNYDELKKAVEDIGYQVSK